MRLTPDDERALLDTLEAEPDEHLLLPADGDGSIRISRDGGRILLHRYLYQELIGPIPDGMLLIKNCSAGGCQNPRHRELSASTGGINPLPYAAAVNAAKTECPERHPYSKENTYTHTDKNGNTHRRCKTCTIERVRKARTLAAQQKEST